MIPTTAKAINGGSPETRRRVLFTQGLWEIVMFSAHAKAYAVHSCQGEPPTLGNIKEPMVDGGDPLRPGPPRAITKAATMAKARLSKIGCWSCEADVPDDIVTIAELYNG